MYTIYTVSICEFLTFETMPFLSNLDDSAGCLLSAASKVKSGSVEKRMWIESATSRASEQLKHASQQVQPKPMSDMSELATESQQLSESAWKIRSLWGYWGPIRMDC